MYADLAEGVTYFGGAPVGDALTGLGDQGFGGYSPEQIEGTTPPAEQGLPGQDALRYGQQAYKAYGLVKQLLGGDGEGRDFPERRGDQSDGEYWQDIAVDYLGLDPVTMANAGLEPGTPEYMNYILEQADAIIAQIFGADPSALYEAESVEDLQAALRGKTQKEMMQLARALNVRGQLGQSVSATEAVDPFTDMMQELGAGFTGQRDVAAAQRGRAGEVKQLAGLRGGEARDFLGGLLGRTSDLFGMQSARDARAIQELLTQAEADDKRRRGMEEAGSGDFWQDILEGRDPAALERILASLGDEERQGSAVERLFGWK